LLDQALFVAGFLDAFVSLPTSCGAGWMDGCSFAKTAPPFELHHVAVWNSGLGVFAGLTWSTQLGSSLYAFCASDWVQFIRCTEKIGWCSEQTAISGALLCPAQGMSARPAVLVFKSHWSFRIMVY
jgi:hypothetical protein